MQLLASQWPVLQKGLARDAARQPWAGTSQATATERRVGAPRASVAVAGEGEISMCCARGVWIRLLGCDLVVA